ncbi:transaldolase family protein [Streptomyces sp. NPDC048718]|uniref:transaldolase family protein n=1 Tax=Streptomyces sp. NPDC048718 TaxID=3365587 RepID=UPI00371E7FB0
MAPTRGVTAKEADRMSQAWRLLEREGVDVWIDVTALGGGAAHEVRRALAQGEVAGARMGAPRGRSADAIRQACDSLLPLYRRSGGSQGLVSVQPAELTAKGAEPSESGAGGAPGAEGTPGAAPGAGPGSWVARARALREEIGRPNLVVRIPVQAADPATLRALFALGIPVEVCRVRSPRQYGQAATALVAALDRPRPVPGDPSGTPVAPVTLVSFISFDLTGLDQRVDARLDLIGSDEAKALRGRAGLAAARLAHRVHEMTFSSARWGALAAAGAPEPKQLWVADAPTPRRSAHYVQELVTEGTATAMTPAAAHALADAGVVAGDRVWRQYADAERTLKFLDWFDISVEAVAAEGATARGGTVLPSPRAAWPAPPVTLAVPAPAAAPAMVP